MFFYEISIKEFYLTICLTTQTGFLKIQNAIMEIVQQLAALPARPGRAGRQGH
jgi:hypothetical protein